MPWKHPELKEGEVLLGNNTPKGFDNIGWKSKRAGFTAYDSDNKPIPLINNLFPVFVQKKELDQAGVTV